MLGYITALILHLHVRYSTEQKRKDLNAFHFRFFNVPTIQIVSISPTFPRAVCVLSQHW